MDSKELEALKSSQVKNGSFKTVSSSPIVPSSPLINFQEMVVSLCTVNLENPKLVLSMISVIYEFDLLVVAWLSIFPAAPLMRWTIEWPGFTL